MVLNFLLYLVSSLIDLLKGSLIAFVPVFVLVLAGKFVRGKLLQKFPEFSWIKSALISTYLLCFLLLIAAYFYPLISSFGQSTAGQAPSIYALTPMETLISFIVYLARLLFVAAVLTLLLIPLEFVGLFVFEKLGEKYADLNYYLRIAFSVYLMTVFASIILLYLFPWLLTGLIFLVFFG